MKFASLKIIREITGEYPVLLLDDVLSELDLNRKKYILRSIKDIQTIITCAGIEDLNDYLDDKVKIFNVSNGQILNQGGIYNVLHLGENVVVPIKDIIGIFDLQNTMYSSDTIQFLRLAEEDGFVERITEEKPKSFIIAEVDNKSKIYLSPISSTTLTKRTDIEYSS